MAWANIDSRRMKVDELLRQGVDVATIINTCSHEFGCSKSAIHSDLKVSGYQPIRPVKVDPPCGIYALIVNDRKAYIGASVRATHRMNQHLHYLRKGKHKCRGLQDDFNADGETNISLTIIKICAQKVLLTEERNAIQEFKQKGYHLYNTYKL